MAFVISRSPSLSRLQPRRPRSPSLALQPHQRSGWGAAHRRSRRVAGWCCRAAPEGWGQQEPGWGSGEGNAQSPAVGQLQDLDLNQLQTALNVAIAAEDYELASAIRDALQRVAGEAPPADWGSLGVLPWLAERAEYLGFRLPTGAKGKQGVGECRSCRIEAVGGRREKAALCFWGAGQWLGLGSCVRCSPEQSVCAPCSYEDPVSLL